MVMLVHGGTEHTYDEAAKRQGAMFTHGLSDHDRSVLVAGFAREFLPPTAGCFHGDGLATVKGAIGMVNSRDPRYEGPVPRNAAGEPIVTGHDTGLRALTISCHCGARAEYRREPSFAEHQATERWLRTGVA